MKSYLNKFFKIEERNSSFSKEIIAGIIMFFAIIYTIPVNTSLIAKTGMSEDAAFTVTAVVSALTTLLIGLVTNRSFVMASGAGMNAFFVFTLSGALGYSWQEALGIVLVSSIIFFVLSMSGIRTKIVNAIPQDLKFAISAALGLFLAFIGLNMGGVITHDVNSLVKLGDITNPVVLLSLFGILLVLILSVLPTKINRFAIVIAMLVTAGLGLLLGAFGVENMPSFNFETKVNFKETFGVAFLNFDVLLNPKTYPLIISCLFVQLFDATGSVVAIGSDMGIIDDEGNLIDAKKIVFSDSASLLIANTFGGLSSITVAESAVAVKNGARTGLASVVVSILILSTLVTFPIFSIFSTITIDGVSYTPVTSLALIYIGIMLFSNIKKIDFDNLIIVITSFIIIIMTVFTYSIVNGLGIGFIAYILLMIASKRGREVHWVIHLITVFYIASFVLDYLLIH